MQRKAETSSETTPEDDGPVGKFLDSLPDDDTDDGDDDTDDGDDEDDDDDDDDDGEGERLPFAAQMAVPVANPDPKPEPTPPKKRGRPSNAERAAKANAMNMEPDSFIPATPRGVKGPRSLTPEQSSRSPALNAARNFQESAYQEIDSLLASLNFATREYEVRVDRLEPDRDENDVPCSGHLADYKDKVTIGDISRRFGGGLYLIRIFGPHPTTGRPGIIKQERFKVAGPPKPMKSNRDEKRTGQPPEAMAEVLRTISETNERNQQRVVDLLERTRDTPSAVETIMPLVLPVIEKLISKNEEATRAILEAQKEDRRRDEERRAEEARREENRRAEARREEEKREDRRREEERKAEEARRDAERRAEEARREELRMEREAQAEARREERERAREERERLKEEARLEAAERQRQHERDLAAQKEAAQRDLQQQQTFMQMLQQFNAAQMEALHKRQENGGIEAVTAQLLALNDLRTNLTGSDREPSGMEKFTEGLERVAATVMPVAQQVMSARRPSVVVGQAVPQQQQRPVVVDLGPRRPSLPPVQNPAPVQPVPTATATAAPTTGAEEKIVNDLTDFVTPTPDDDMVMAGTKLIKNVDLAVQRNMTAEQIVKMILEPFEESAAMVTAMLSGMSTEQLLEFIEGNVPSDWAIMSPRGEELVTKAFELWQDTDEDSQGGET